MARPGRPLKAGRNTHVWCLLKSTAKIDTKKNEKKDHVDTNRAQVGEGLVKAP